MTTERPTLTDALSRISANDDMLQRKLEVDALTQIFVARVSAHLFDTTVPTAASLLLQRVIERATSQYMDSVLERRGASTLPNKVAAFEAEMVAAIAGETGAGAV